ncbi:enoyl-CoA hydratase-related protein [Myxococcota bacterium]|nr:enoyl-CoA hydratase-related protein [Myxococcota bacterium]
MEPQNYETLLVEVDNGVATLTLNRPDRMNAFNHTMSTELARAFAALDHADEVRAIVVTGAGRAFCAGVDIDGGLPQGDGAPKHWRSSESAATFRPWEMHTPIIAAINGAAVGLGLTYPMLWDIRVAAEDAKLGFVFNRRGFLPEGNSLWLLSRLVGASCALELLLTGRMFDGREAAELKLVSRAVPTDQVLPAAQQIARDIAENTAPVSTAITKRLFYSFLESSDRLGARAEELDYVRWAMEQPDFREGMSAFLEKRTPQWTGTDLPAGLR